MKTILEVLQLAEQYLKKREIRAARTEAQELISCALDIPKMQLYLDHDRPLDREELARCRKWLARRARGEPLAYIRGSVDFYGIKISLTADVLIPRQETEILVDRIVQELKEEELQGKALLDLCTGSGCIGLALKKRFPQLKVFLSDISAQAIEVCRNNAKRNNLEVQCLLGDLAQPLIDTKIDIVVCNPPYISQEEYQELDPEVKDFEPKQALYAREEGIEFYRRLSTELPKILNADARVWLEIGAAQGNAARQLFKKKPWKSCEVGKDWSGHDRFVRLQI